MNERQRPRIIRTPVNLEEANSGIYQPMERERFGNVSVLKFGGAALEDARSIEQSVSVLARHHANGESVIVVVSAMSGVTDALESIVSSRRSHDNTATGNRLKAIYERHLDALWQIPMYDGEREERHHDLYRITGDIYSAVYRPGSISSARKAEVLAQGERMSEFLFATCARAQGLPVTAFDSSDFIVTNSEFENATPDMRRSDSETRRSLGPVLKRGGIPIVTGFFAANEQGDITLLGRNCSDYSAALIARIMGAKNFYLYKNVDGIFDRDPNKYTDANLIRTLTVEDYYLTDGAQKAVHPYAIKILEGTNSTIWVRNFRKPEDDGTEIVRASQQE